MPLLSCANATEPEGSRATRRTHAGQVRLAVGSTTYTSTRQSTSPAGWTTGARSRRTDRRTCAGPSLTPPRPAGIAQPAQNSSRSCEPAPHSSTAKCKKRGSPPIPPTPTTPIRTGPSQSEQKSRPQLSTIAPGPVASLVLRRPSAELGYRNESPIRRGRGRPALRKWPLAVLA